jgi:hypothetical protein
LLTITGSPLLQWHWKCLKPSWCTSTALGQYKKLSLESSRKAAFLVLLCISPAFLTTASSASWSLYASASSSALRNNLEMPFVGSSLLSSSKPWSHSLFPFGQGMLPSPFALHPDLEHSRVSQQQRTQRSKEHFVQVLWKSNIDVLQLSLQKKC